jgi:hypothetical protein
LGGPAITTLRPSCYVDCVDFADQFGQPQRDVAVGEEVDLLVGEVDRRLDVAAQRDQAFDQRVDARREHTLQRTQRGARRGLAAAGDQVGDRLGLGQVEFAVEERAGAPSVRRARGCARARGRAPPDRRDRAVRARPRR